MAASEKNIAEAKRVMTVQTIGYDKINMLRHVKYFKNADGGVRATVSTSGSSGMRNPF